MISLKSKLYTDNCGICNNIYDKNISGKVRNLYLNFVNKCCYKIFQATLEFLYKYFKAHYLMSIYEGMSLNRHGLFKRT